MKPFLLILLLQCIILLPGAAQDTCNDLNWPDDPALQKMARDMLARYGDELNAGNYQAAVKPHQWLLANTPDFNLSLYINGAKIFNGLAEATDDKVSKMVYVDSLMLVYNMRTAYCNNESEVAARQAYDHYRHTIRETGRLTANLELFDRAYALNRENIPSYMILPYMNVLRFNKKYTSNIGLDGFLDRYEMVEEALSINEGKEEMEKIREASEAIFFEVLGGESLDCAMINDKLGMRYRQDPENTNKAKLVFKSMLNAKCTDDPLFLEIAKNLSAGGGYKFNYTMGKLAISKGNLKDAESFFIKALEMAMTNEEISDSHLSLGMLKKEQGFKPAARTYFQEAIQANPSNREAYSAIGILYYESFEQCRQNEDLIVDRAVYLAAYDQFMKAGDTELAAMAKSQFPSRVEIFDWNYEIGQELVTNCWMKEEVIIRARDQ